jgi:putative signal transducing protein
VKELLRSHTLSYVQGLHVALEAQGIETMLLDEQTIGYLGFAGRVRLLVVKDSDYEPALQIVRELEARPPARRIPVLSKAQGLGCAGVLAGFVLLAAGLLAGAIALFVIGVTLVIFGAGRDSPDSP